MGQKSNHVGERKNGNFAMRLRGFVFMCAGITSISIFCGPGCLALTETDKYEGKVLQQWKTTAKTTAVGKELLRLLELANGNLAYDPRDKASLYQRAYLLGTIGCTQSALADLTRLIQLDPRNAAAYKERGLCFMDLKDYNRAFSDLNNAVLLNPKSGDALMARGRVLLALNRASFALADFRACQAADVRFSTALPGELPGNYYGAPEYYLAVSCQATSRITDAIRHYKESIKAPRVIQTGWLHRYADQPTDKQYRLTALEASR